MSSLYEKRPLDANGNVIGMVLQGTQRSIDQVAIYNMVTLKYSSIYGQQGPVTEESLKSIINEMLEQCICGVEGISAAQAMEVKHALSNICTNFSMQPRLSGHMDFVTNASYLLCRILGLTVLHGWVLNPEVSSYDSLNRFSHEELLKHTCDLKGQNDQHCDVVYIYVTDEDIRKQMSEAVWMLFEECQERNIYFTEKYTTVKGQPCEKEAREWYMRFLQMKNTRMKNEKVTRTIS
ncbi:hypothetical protein SETIT_1G344000v2 [Setaria italica]|uniref:MINDY deubiquitinase domain-containing protein n=1 Tax=Setaria italica TaxID=4555 RepID=A0A368PSP6_SETIT|nr:hypothetical protein SETIT_1G344000v2 [Setaria italica]